MYNHLYMKANRTAGYSGFVVYYRSNDKFNSVYGDSDSCWMIPGTFFDDWDN